MKVQRLDISKEMQQAVIKVQKLRNVETRVVIYAERSGDVIGAYQKGLLKKFSKGGVQTMLAMTREVGPIFIDITRTKWINANCESVISMKKI